MELEALNKTEMLIISVQLSRCRDEEIAYMLNRPLWLIKAAIEDILKSTPGRVSKSSVVKKLKDTGDRKKIQKRVAEIAKQRAAAQTRKKVEPVIQSRQVDYSQKILIRIDAKTSIYINAGDDPVAAREAFLKRMKKIW